MTGYWHWLRKQDFGWAHWPNLSKSDWLFLIGFFSVIGGIIGGFVSALALSNPWFLGLMIIVGIPGYLLLNYGIYLDETRVLETKRD